MAVYHFTSKTISRGAGQSAVHTAAYNSRDQLFDEKENRHTRDYGHGGRQTEFSAIFAPPDAPAWVHDRGELWNRAEAAEKRKDAQTARNLEFALPHELTPEQRERLVKDFARETFARKGMVADVSIHAPDKDTDPRNFHVHCLLTMRRLEGEGFAPTKAREWNDKALYGQWREKWAHMGAKALERAGFHVEAERFKHGHETLAKQRAAALERGDLEHATHCDREPTQHKGPIATAQERRGEETARQKAEREAGQEAQDLAAEIKADEKELAEARQKAAEGREPSKAGQEAQGPENAPTAKNPALAGELEQSAGKDRRGDLDGAQMWTDTKAAAKRERETAAHEAWASSDKTAPEGNEKEARGLSVADGAAGIVTGLSNFVLGFLDSLAGNKPAPAPKPSPMQQRRQALKALGHIKDSIEKGESLNAEDVRHLTPTHLQNIHQQGDSYLRGLVEQLDRDQERERDIGRYRER